MTWFWLVKGWALNTSRVCQVIQGRRRSSRSWCQRPLMQTVDRVPGVGARGE